MDNRISDNKSSSQAATQAEGNWSVRCLLGGPVGDLPALQHRPPVPLQVVQKGDYDG